MDFSLSLTSGKAEKFAPSAASSRSEILRFGVTWNSVTLSTKDVTVGSRMNVKHSCNGPMALALLLQLAISLREVSSVAVRRSVMKIVTVKQKLPQENETISEPILSSKRLARVCHHQGGMNA